MDTKSVALAPKPAGWEAEPPKKISGIFNLVMKCKGEVCHARITNIPSDPAT